LTSAPPEFPGLIGASVWMKSSKSATPTSARPTALTMPNVTVRLNPSGLPMASTKSPTAKWLEFPHVAVGRFDAWIFTTATSVFGSVATTFPLNWRRSAKITSTSTASATTWLFVMMYPSGETITPDPWPYCRRVGGSLKRPNGKASSLKA